MIGYVLSFSLILLFRKYLQSVINYLTCLLQTPHIMMKIIVLNDEVYSKKKMKRSFNKTLTRFFVFNNYCR